MEPVVTVLSLLAGIPIAHMLALIALAGFGLAVFAIHVVFSLARGQQRK